MLIRGNEMAALSASDLFFRWSPGVEATLMRVHHPQPNLDTETSPTARFYGYPPALAATGIVAGDDSTYRFITVLDGWPHNRWHRDVDWSLGIPAADTKKGAIYTGIGGPGAVSGVMAIDAGNGAVLWS